MVEVVDADGRVVDVVPRSVMRRERLRHRSVYIAVVHPDGRLLVHRRSDAKDVWPGWWDLAVGGVVTPGEPWDDAAARELAEEIGVSGVAMEELGGGAYEDDLVAVVGRCYRVVTAGPFTFADGEVVEAEWVAPADLPRLVRERRFLPDALALLLPLL
jgi:8-oxo-dGTP pyrophosphatase MutT (NUDIX family)